MIDRFMIPMMTFSLVELVVVSMVRVTTSYRAIELGLSPLWVGIITASFALLPIFFLLHIGRIVDRGHGVTVVRIGSAGLVVGSACLWFDQSLASLIVFVALIGFGHGAMTISAQVLCAIQPGPGAIERGLGNYMVATAIGQGVGPAIVGWVGGSAAIPPVAPLFGIAALIGIAGFIATLVMRSREVRTSSTVTAKPTTIREILAIPNIKAVLVISAMTVVAQDIAVVYLPLLANERNIPVDVVGSLLTVRAVASVAARMGYARLTALLGREPLMWTATLMAGVTYVCLAVPMPLAMIYVVIAIMGGTLGLSTTVSVASLLTMTNAGSRGVANSIRSGGIRAGQVVLPFAAGLVATAAGAASVFVIVGATLAITTVAAYVGQKR